MMGRRRLQRDQDKPDDMSKRDPERKKASPPPPPARTYPDPVDDTLDGSFPASDPPPWWAG